MSLNGSGLWSGSRPALSADGRQRLLILADAADELRGPVAAGVSPSALRREIDSNNNAALAKYLDGCLLQ